MRVVVTPALPPAGEQQQQQPGGGGDGGSGSSGGSLVGSLGLWALWGGLAAYTFLVAPNQTPLRDSYFIEKLVGLGANDGVQVGARQGSLAACGSQQRRCVLAGWLLADWLRGACCDPLSATPEPAAAAAAFASPPCS